MLSPSRRFVVVVLAFGILGIVPRALANERADPWKTVARYELVYQVRLRELAPAGGPVSLWVPYPAETPDQRVVAAHIDSPWPERLTREEKYGNKMVHLEGKA